jgi:shikimate dehydrogenase
MLQEVKTYGLIGKKISYSFSKTYFTKKFLKNNLKNYNYINFDIDSVNELSDILKTKNLRGLNITIPYKEKVLKFIDRIDEDAKFIGAINTIKVSYDNTLVGYNTDYIGFIKSIKPHIKSNHKKALILGTGGASKAIVYGLNKLSIISTKVSRKKTNGDIIYNELNKKIILDHQIIINCTPIGTYPDIENYPKIPFKYLTNKHICYDLIYNPNETTFLKKSKKMGAEIINGLKMLEIQAEESWKIWNS